MLQCPRARSSTDMFADAIAVGYQATTSDGKTEQPNVVLEALISVVRPTGGLGIPGLYVPSDPGAPDAQSKKYVYSRQPNMICIMNPTITEDIFRSPSENCSRKG